MRLLFLWTAICRTQWVDQKTCLMVRQHQFLMLLLVMHSTDFEQRVKDLHEVRAAGGGTQELAHVFIDVERDRRKPRRPSAD